MAQLFHFLLKKTLWLSKVRTQLDASGVNVAASIFSSYSFESNDDKHIPGIVPDELYCCIIPCLLLYVDHMIPLYQQQYYCDPEIS